MSKDKARTDRRHRELQRLQLAVAKQQAEMEESRLADVQVEHVKPVVGMPADVVLTLPGYSRRDATHRPVRAGWNQFGLKVKWFYKDVTLLFVRDEADGPYKVAEIEEKGSDEKQVDSDS